jgi:hypothetical protein
MARKINKYVNSSHRLLGSSDADKRNTTKNFKGYLVNVD